MIGENLKYYRNQRKYSQEEMAGKLGIPRSSYSGYENGVAEPSIRTILKLAEIFKISTDDLLKDRPNVQPLSGTDEAVVYSDFISGSNLRVIVTSTDHAGEENIELVPESARAGYASGYADPDFIRVLPAFNLPFLSRGKKFRAFPVSGDSMPPVTHGSHVIAEYVENWSTIRDGFPYIVVTRQEGIVFKILYNELKSNHSLRLCSTNPLYQPYDIRADDLLEVWKFVNYICPEFNEIKPDEGHVSKSLRDLQQEVAQLKSAVQSK